MARSPNVREKAACQGPGTMWLSRSAALTRHAHASPTIRAKPRHNRQICNPAWNGSPSATPRPRITAMAPVSPHPPTRPTTNSPSPTNSPPAPTSPTRTYPPRTQPRIGPDGSWDWKGRHLTPEQSRLADQALAKCRDAEGRDADGNYGDHGLTPAMRRIEAQLDHGHLVEDTEKFALKDPDRFKEKLAKLIHPAPQMKAQMTCSGDSRWDSIHLCKTIRTLC